MLQDYRNAGEKNNKQNIIVLSAETKQQLYKITLQLLDNIKINNYSDADLDNICYTLQIGREHMKVRLAVLVTSIKDLVEKISGFLEDADNCPNIFFSESNTFSTDNKEELQEYLKSLIKHGKYSSIADLWVKGENVDWNLLYENVEEPLSFISLPTYPFEKEKYWIKEVIDMRAAQLEEISTEKGLEPDFHEEEKQWMNRNQNIIVLSAGTKQQLDQVVLRLTDAIKLNNYSDEAFHNICYTLQIGREHMKNRLAFAADSVKDMFQKLNDYLHKEGIELYVSDENSVDLSSLNNDEELQEYIERLIEHGKYNSIANLWTKGIPVDWELLYRYTAKPPVLMSLPTYPFEKEKYWLKDVLKEAAVEFSDNNIQSQDAYKLMTFKEIWKENNILKQEGKDIDNLVVFLSDEEKCMELKEEFNSRGCKNIIFVKRGTGNNTNNYYEIEYENKNSYVNCLYDIKKQMKNITNILYLWDFDRDTDKEDWTGMVYLLQALYESDVWQCGLILAGEYDDTLHKCFLESWIGLARSMKLIMPELMIKTISWESNHISNAWIKMLWDELLVTENINILYEDGIRKTTNIVPVDLNNDGREVLKKGGTYFITGGLGGLGRIFAKWLAEKYDANLILVGRSERNKKKDLLDEIEEINSKILYVQADVCDFTQMKAAVEKSKNEFGRIDGVIHAAGLEGKSSIIDKDIYEFNQILAANIDGTLVLDEIFCDEDVDFICYFSSSAAIIGDFGSGCYAAGKRFQMAYAKYKEDGRKRVVINWPLWDSTGMKLEDEQGNDMYMKSSGQKLLGPKEGTMLFEKILGQDSNQFLVINGQEEKAYQFLGISASPYINKEIRQYTVNTTGERNTVKKADMEELTIKQCIICDVKNIVSKVLKIAVSKLTVTDSFANFGFDSISLAALADQLRDFYKIKITPDIFFSYPNIDKLCGFFLEKYPVEFEEIYNKNKTSISSERQACETAAIDEETLSRNLIKDIKKIVCRVIRAAEEKIGLNDNFADFGFDSISLAKLSDEISEYFGIKITANIFFNFPNIAKLSKYLMEKYRDKVMKSYITTLPHKEMIPGGQRRIKAHVEVQGAKRQPQSHFIKNAGGDTVTYRQPISIIGMSGRFPDSRNVEELWDILESGREVLREVVYERKEWNELAFDNERKGKRKIGAIPGVSEFEPLFFEIAPRDAEKMDPRQRLLLQETWKALEDAGYGKELLESDRIGMFVGAEEGDYSSIVGEGNGITSNSISVLPARLAYFLNLHGPNMAIDTACSSGLTALHQACLSIWMGECDAAIVAGVSVLATADAYKMMENSKMLSSDGKCYAFDKRANGMVPAEGIAVVVIKREDKAKEDRNPIYANIIGSGINYDGKTNGITAPNGQSQTKLLKDIYDKFRIDPKDISYIVTHGTGTKLGDPIEINALSDAFKDYASQKGYCALTSTKPNIGHSLAASGLVSLISLVLAMKKECIPASINCETLNDYIDWEDSPFYINRTNKAWKAGKNKRIGGVSAFGMSGTNVHVVVESCDDTVQRSAPEASMEKEYYLINLSAKTKESLQMIMENLLDVLENDCIKEADMPALSYTLMQGRQHFNLRCSMVVRDKAETIELLKAALDERKHPNIFNGRVRKDFIPQSKIQQSILDFIEDGKRKEHDQARYRAILFVLADLYCKGYDEVCMGMWNQEHPARISLPTYPFLRENYWITGNENNSRMSNALQLHPMIQKNVSDSKGKKFTSVFCGDELFFNRKL